MTTDERIDALEKALQTAVRRQRITITALVLLAVAAAVMAAAPQSRDATFDYITAKGLLIVNDAGKLQANLGVYGDGGGLSIFNSAGKVHTSLGANENGGTLWIYNKTGEEVVQILVDEYGNGYVGAFNRMGRTLQPGN